tara:strand:+ start:4559 stop:5926 length:1368 start_codon:yes stop_codon:yes gene_type:complete
MIEFTLFDAERDLNSPNRNISPTTAQVNADGQLMVGGCILSDLASRYGTPLYVLDEQTIRTTCQAYVQSLKKYYPGPSQALYASKANSSLAMCSLMLSEGMGIDAVSGGELITALKAGVSSELIFFHGNNKSEDELHFAYKNGVTIVIDNQYDIERLEEIVPTEGPPANLMLRFTPGIECHTHQYIRTGHLDSKFGFDPDQLEVVLKALKIANWSNLTGLHAHIGSQIFELDPHKDLVKVMIKTLKLASDIGHSISDLNIGGGLGVRYVASDNPPSINRWVKLIAQELVAECTERNIELPRLMCEPGRSLVCNSGVTLYTIGSRKNIPGIRTYISVDGGMSDNPRPITYQSLYSACLVDKVLEQEEEVVTVAGKHCESGDILLKDYPLPFPKSGDILSVFGTGAYNFSMSSNYNRIPRPAAVIVKNGVSELIQRREEPEDLLRLDVLPDRFMGIH